MAPIEMVSAYLPVAWPNSASPTLFTMLGTIAGYSRMIFDEVKQGSNFIARDEIGL